LGLPLAGRLRPRLANTTNRIFNVAYAIDAHTPPVGLGCSQHAPDEHILLSVTEEALGIMAGLFWDLGELPRPLAKSA
jgi:hypothetical protein